MDINYFLSRTAALLGIFLVIFGNVIGWQPHCMAEDVYHAINLLLLFGGSTSKGRKGTAIVSNLTKNSSIKATEIGNITRRFQITIPESIVKQLGLQVGDSVLFEEQKGKIIVSPLVPAGESVDWLKKRKPSAKSGK